MSQDGSTKGGLWQRWAGPEDDWIEKLIRDPPQKEDVITSLMKMMGRPTAHLTKNGGIPSKAPRDLEPFVLGPPTNTEGIALEIRRDKDGGRRINGKAKQKKTIGAVGAAQRQLRNGGAKAWIYAEELMTGRCRFSGNITKMLTLGRKGGREENSKLAWSEVTGLCGFWDGSCRRCGNVPHALGLHDSQ